MENYEKRKKYKYMALLLKLANNNLWATLKMVTIFHTARRSTVYMWPKKGTVSIPSIHTYTQLTDHLLLLLQDTTPSKQVCTTIYTYAQIHMCRYGTVTQL